MKAKSVTIYINFLYYLGPWYILNAKLLMRHCVVFIKPRKFDTADVKCFTGIRHLLVEIEFLYLQTEYEIDAQKVQWN